MAYVDGYVLVVPKRKARAYKKMAQEGAKIWKRCGALDYKECVMDDVKPKWVTFTFPKMAKAKKGEEVWFSYVVFKSKAHRNLVNKKVMAEMDKKYKDHKAYEIPFDMKRMAYGGFKVVVDA